MNKKNLIYIIISIIAVLVIIPLSINVAFKVAAPIEILHAEWDASAAITFYGTVLAAGIAVIGVFITIRYSQSNYREDVRNRTLPYIAITLLRTKAYKNIFGGNSEIKDIEPEEGYQEYKLQDYFCVLEKGDIQYKTKLSKRQQQILDYGGTKWENIPNGRSLQVVDDVCVPIEIENVGNGVAINLRLGLNRKGVPEKDQRFVSPISLKVGATVMLHLFSEDCGRDSKNTGEYVLSFYYEDIYQNQYIQEYDVNIQYDEDERQPVFSIDMEVEQQCIGGAS